MRSLTPLLLYVKPGMRTNPPGEDREEREEREEGEGKKPTVVGEPGGLEKEKEKRQPVIKKISE